LTYNVLGIGRRIDFPLHPGYFPKSQEVAEKHPNSAS
jgi:hypothetical protein